MSSYRSFGNDTKPPAVMKLKSVGELCFDLLPEPPNGKVLMARSDIVQQDDSTVLYLWQPGAKVVTYRFVGMKSIDMQKINGAVLKLRECVVEASP